MPCCGCTPPMSGVPGGCSPMQDCHPASAPGIAAPVAPHQSCRVGQWLLRAAATRNHQWEAGTHLCLLQSCLDIALLALQGFLQLLELVDGFAAQTDLVSQISNFLWQGQKGVRSGMSLRGQPRIGDFPIPLPRLSQCPPQPLGEQLRLCLGTFLGPAELPCSLGEGEGRGESLRTHGDLLVQEQHPQASAMPQPWHSGQQNM